MMQVWWLLCRKAILRRLLSCSPGMRCAGRSIASAFSFLYLYPMIDRLRAIKNKYMDLELRLSDPVVVNDIKVFSKFHKEYKDLTELVEVIDQYELVLANIDSSTLMLKESDPEMRELAGSEIESLKEQKDQL